MNQTHNFLKYHLLISTINFAVIDIKFKQILDKLIDDGHVIGIHDDIHHYDDNFLVVFFVMFFGV